MNNVLVLFRIPRSKVSAWKFESKGNAGSGIVMQSRKIVRQLLQCEVDTGGLIGLVPASVEYRCLYIRQRSVSESHLVAISCASDKWASTTAVVLNEGRRGHELVLNLVRRGPAGRYSNG